MAGKKVDLLHGIPFWGAMLAPQFVRKQLYSWIQDGQKPLAKFQRLCGIIPVDPTRYRNHVPTQAERQISSVVDNDHHGKATNTILHPIMAFGSLLGDELG